MSRQSKIAIIVILVFTLILVFSFTQQNVVTDNELEFSQELWNDNIYERKNILDDFFFKYDVTKMTKNDITAILGEPTYIEMTDSYVIGKGDALGSPNLFIRFYYDETGLYCSHEIFEFE